MSPFRVRHRRLRTAMAPLLCEVGSSPTDCKPLPILAKKYKLNQWQWADCKSARGHRPRPATRHASGPRPMRRGLNLHITKTATIRRRVEDEMFSRLPAQNSRAVMAGLVPAIHDFVLRRKTWMLAT